jgi:cephalosporin hydroxylase
MRRFFRRLRRAARAFREAPRPRIERGLTRAPTGFAPLDDRQQAIVDDFHRLYYEQRVEGRRTVILSWLGWRMLKCPFDLWTYQEIIVETRPQLIIECGTRFGGGALFLASLFDLLGGGGTVISIDTDTEPVRPTHPRIRYIAGSTTDPAIVAQVRAAAAGKRTMVILDSDHSAAHVRNELATYPEFVTKGCYLIVDDTDIGGNPVWQDEDPGPMAAVVEFLASTDSFVADRDRERFMLTLNPNGFLRRVQ